MTLSRARRNAWIGISLILLFSVLFGYQATDIRFDYDFENFFPEGDAETEFYQKHRERFGSDNDLVLIGIQRPNGIFHKAFLQRVDALADSLRELPHVEQVRSPTDLSFRVRDPVMGGSFERPYLRIDEPQHYAKDSSRIYRIQELVGTFFAEDARSLCLTLHNEDQLAKGPSDTLASRIRKAVHEANFQDERTHLAGRVIGQKHYVKVMKREFFFFLSLSFILVLLFLIFIFRSWWGVLIPLAVVLLSIGWIIGIMSWLNEPINLLLTILPTILFVVGTSDVVHLLSKYEEDLKRGWSKFQALEQAFREIGMATFLTSVTTAAGFLTLLTASIAPIRDFGIYTAIGVFIAFFMAFTLLPALLLLVQRPRIHSTVLAHPVWHRALHRSLMGILRHRKSVMGIGLLVILGSLWGIQRIDLDKKMLEDLDQDDPLQQDFRFFEREFAGVRPFEMAIRAKGERSVFDPALIKTLDTIQDYLRAHYKVGSILSPATLFEQANMAYEGGDPEAHRLPTDPERFRRIQKQLKGFRKDERMRRLVTEDLQRTHITGRMPDLGSQRVRALNDSLHRFISKNTDTSLYDYKLTGAARLIDRNNALLSANMLEGLLIAFLVITLIVVALFRSFKMIGAVLIPNILPLLMIGGIMGWVGIPLKVSTSVIFTIAFGIAVDDTIHFTNRLKLELDKGKDLLYAIKRTYISTGRAILMTTLILCCGFITLIGSDFIGAYNIGLLITMTLFFALLADLTILPVLLMLLFKRRELSRGEKTPPPIDHAP